MNGQPELRLLLEQHQTLEQPRLSVGLVGTLAVHLLLAFLAAILPASSPTRVSVPRFVTELRHTPLVAPPPRELTQRDPNTGRVSQEVNLPGLLARRSPVPAPPAPPAPTRPAAPQTVQAPLTPAPVAPAPKPAAEPPAAQPPPPPPPVTEVARNVPPAGTPDPAPPPEPQIQTVEKPKLAFEKPGSQIGTPAGSGAGARRVIDPPRPASIQEAARTVARGGGGGLTVGDVGAAGAGGLGEALSGAPGQRQASSLELLSDPEGIDFKPYLIQILSTIRRNWLAVLPESARLGRRGRVQIQFAVDRSGGIPKLVIALPSGTDALDRAAVAGISASNPLPPLPPDFKGEQVRLQFTFLYNLPAR